MKCLDVGWLVMCLNEIHKIKDLKFSFLYLVGSEKTRLKFSYLYVWIPEHMKEKQTLTRLLASKFKLSLNKDDAQVSNYCLLQIRVWTLQDV